MRIVHVIARLNIGGPAVHVGLVCSGLRAAGHEAQLLAGRVVPPEGDMEYACTERGVQPIYAERLGRSLSPAGDAATLRLLTSFFRKFRPDVVHTHTSKAGVLGRLAARLAGVRAVVHTFHGNVLHGYFGSLANRAIKLVESSLARRTDAIVVLGERQREELLACGIGTPERVHVVPFGMDLERLAASPVDRESARASFGLPTGVPVVGIVGRLTAIKGHRHFLHMAARLRSEEALVRFLVVGDGELRRELEALTHRLHLSDAVTFAGWQKDLPTVYAAMDGLALTSENEGSPVVLKEAMAAGVPCAAHRVGGVPDLVQDEQTGYLVPAGDVCALIRAVRRCLTPGAEREALVRKARCFVLERHGTRPMLERLEALYRSLG